MLCNCSNSNTLFKIMSECKKCFHPCHCGEDDNLHADEYGLCTCESCECSGVKDVDKTWENEVGYE